MDLKKNNNAKKVHGHATNVQKRTEHCKFFNKWRKNSIKLENALKILVLRQVKNEQIY